MAAYAPPGASRQGSGNAQPPPNQSSPNYNNPNAALADHMQNMNLRPPNSSPSPFSRPVGPTPYNQPPQGFPAGSQTQTASRPGPPMASPFMRPPGPPSATPQSTLAPNVAPGRPAAPPSMNHPPPFASRPPPTSSFPSSMGSNVGPVRPPASGPFFGGPLSTPQPPAARPGPFSSSGLSTGPVVPPSNAPVGPMTNGPQGFVSGASAGAPRFLAPPGSAPQMQPPRGPPSAMASARGPQAPTIRSLISGAPTNAPLPVPPMQSTPPFSASPPALPPSTSSFAAQSWQMRPEQMGMLPPVRGPTQPPRMIGMPPTLSSQPSTIAPTGPTPTRTIDPNQIPRPIPSSRRDIHETRRDNQAIPPPPATSDYIVKDTGNCSPRFMRCTINHIPCTADLLTTSGMQLALLVQPLALPHPSEEPIQVVDFGESGPVRCSRCKGYINPFMKFIDQGRRFICNLCGFTDETPRDYHCNLGPDGRRRDADERPELCRGTVEFVASKEYMIREPMPAVYFFLIDVSMNAMQIGATAAACSAISQVISDLPEGPRTMVGIATFDSTIHFYNLKRALQQPLMLIVPDVQDVYTPLQSDVIVPLSECRQHLELLLESIPTMFQNSRTAESAFGAAIKAAFLAMKNTGGKLLVFQSVLPSVGLGALSAREAEGRSNITAGEKEAHKLLQPVDKMLKTMAIEFAEYQVCVDVFLTTQSYIDVASISAVPRTTGGQVYYYHPFSALSDTAKLYNDLRWNITRPQGFEAVMRVRCSQGIQVQEYHGNFCKRIPTDIDLPGIDSDKTVMVTLKHDDKLQDGSECAFQCALLYTTIYGQRRIRVATLSLPCTSMLSNLFRAADLDAQFTCLMKQAAIEIPSKPLVHVREQATNLCINVLLSYRKFCATVSYSGQLILPESLKLLPLYTLALNKSTGLRIDGRIDERSYWVNYVSSVSAHMAFPLVYPRMIALHYLLSKEEDEGILPMPIPLSSEHIEDSGIYLLENGEDALLYVGNSINPETLRQVFGVSSVEEIPMQFVLQQLDNPLSKKVNEVVNEIRGQRCSYLRLRLCKKGDPSGMLFFSHLVEDKNPGGMSYVEFLIYVHQQIQQKMS